MQRPQRRSSWEVRLAQERMPAGLGEGVERHSQGRQRVLSLDVYPELEEGGRAWASRDHYVFDDEGDAADGREAGMSLAEVPAEIRLIGEKRVLGEVLTASERQKLKRYREGRYRGRNGRPRKCHASDPDYEGQ